MTTMLKSHPPQEQQQDPRPHSVPWQFDWKCPQWWQVVNESERDKSSSTSTAAAADTASVIAGLAIDHAAATIRIAAAPDASDSIVANKAPSLTTSARSRHEKHVSFGSDGLDEEENQEDFLLTVTLEHTATVGLAENYPTKASVAQNKLNSQRQRKRRMADTVVIELVCIDPYDPGRSKRVQSRTLRWPAYKLHSLHENEEGKIRRDGDNDAKSKSSSSEWMLPWWKWKWDTSTSAISSNTSHQRQDGRRERDVDDADDGDDVNGLVAVTLCRIPSMSSMQLQQGQLHDSYHIQDTVDVMSLLSLGLEAEPKANTHAAESTSKDNTAIAFNAAANHQPDTQSENDAIPFAGASSVTASLNTTSKEETSASLHKNVSTNLEYSAEAASKSASENDVCVALLSSTGKIYLYSPWSLLQYNPSHRQNKSKNPRKKKAPTDRTIHTAASTSNGMAQLWLGDDLWSTIQETYLPLTHPSQVLKLASIPLWTRSAASHVGTNYYHHQQPHLQHLSRKRRTRRQLSQQQQHQQLSRCESGGTEQSIDAKSPKSSSFHTNMNSEEREDKQMKEIMSPSRQPAATESRISSWDPSLWDSRIDSHSLRYRTRYMNRPIRIITAWEYLCVLGVGQRPQASYPLTQVHLRSPFRSHKSHVNQEPNQQVDDSGLADVGEEDFGIEPQTPSRESPLLGDQSVSSDRPQLDKLPFTGSINLIPAGEDDGLCLDTASSVLSSSSVSSWSSKNPKQYDHDQRMSRVFPDNGGFVTFFSLRTFAEVKTLYLPFLPREISPFLWGDLKFVLVLGHQAHEAVAIRVDAIGMINVLDGYSPAIGHQEDKSYFAITAGVSIIDRSHPNIAFENLVKLRRFQMLHIDLIPEFPEDCPPLFVVGSASLTSPPSIVLVFVDDDDDQHIRVHQRILQGVATMTPHNALKEKYQLQSPTILTKHSLAHVSRIRIPIDTINKESGHFEGPIWCQSGQGWSVLGLANHRYAICWDGATTLHGACAVHIGTDDSETCDHEILASHVIQLDQCASLHQRSIIDNAPVIPDYRSTIGGTLFGNQKQLQNYSSLLQRENDDILDAVISEVLESISSQSYRDLVISSSHPMSPRRLTTSFSHAEKSERLLQLCSNLRHRRRSSLFRLRHSKQMPIISARVHEKAGSAHSFLSLRKIMIDNGVASPFQPILSWLMEEKEDYSTAACVALALTHDISSLRHLWKTLGNGIEENEVEMFEGRLDGIIPMPSMNAQNSLTAEHSSLWTELANTTIRCLTKGGDQFSSTLYYFLQHNAHYDTAYTFLTLVAAAVGFVAEDEEAMIVSGDTTTHRSMEAMLWPVRCLLKAATSRNCLEAALVLLNAAIPDELRRRHRTGSAASSLPSLDLCRALVSLIVASSIDAAEILLSLTDEHRRQTFWESLHHETQLELSLISIDKYFPMIKQPEVRTWLIHLMQRQLVSDHTGISDVHTLWLQRLVTACITNAECTAVFESRFVDLNAMTAASLDDMVQHFGELIASLRAAFSPLSRMGDLDVDILIPVLLLLEKRKADWHEAPSIPTQYVLNAICYWVGRDRHPVLHTPDTSTLMRQCVLTNNVQAGSNLVGGPNGLVLECCGLLVFGAGMSMDNSETFLISNTLVEPTIATTLSHAPSYFTPSTWHCHLLWLLEQHVLSVRTFGEFETASRGRIDPVFAARVCFRTWYVLTKDMKREGSSYLALWLRKKLNMDADQPSSFSSRRLVCAAVARALLWPCDIDRKHPTLVLAAKMELPNTFLVSLTRSCIGLVESLPSYESDKLWNSPTLVNVVPATAVHPNHRKDLSFSSTAYNVSSSFLNESTDDSFVSAATSLLEIDS